MSKSTWATSPPTRLSQLLRPTFTGEGGLEGKKEPLLKPKFPPCPGQKAENATTPRPSSCGGEHVPVVWCLLAAASHPQGSVGKPGGGRGGGRWASLGMQGEVEWGPRRRGNVTAPATLGFSAAIPGDLDKQPSLGPGWASVTPPESGAIWKVQPASAVGVVLTPPSTVCPNLT